MNRLLSVILAFLVIVMLSGCMTKYQKGYVEGLDDCEKREVIVEVEVPAECKEPVSRPYDLIRSSLLELGSRLNELNNDELILKSEIGFENSTIVIASDPITDIEDYEGAIVSSSGEIMSTVFGINGTYIVNEETELEVIILIDNTDFNGFYVTHIHTNINGEVAVYYYNDLFITFKTVISDDATSDKIDNLVEANEIKKLVFEEIMNYFS